MQFFGARANLAKTCCCYAINGGKDELTGKHNLHLNRNELLRMNILDYNEGNGKI